MVRSSLLNVIETSAKPERPRPAEPEKMTSCDSLPRKSLSDCSPSAQRMASDRLDFPEPFGPTTAVSGEMPAFGGRKERAVLWAKVLNPWSSNLVKNITDRL